ncbi:MAG TPA: chromate transporter [Tissierellaceae bacterium]
MLLELFFTFFKIGAFTFGGGFAMIPIIQKEIVEKRGWIEEEDFINIISIAQSSPGPIAVNSSIFVGYTIKGFIGALICTLGTVLPSFITILVIAKFFSQVQDSVIIERVFLGIRPAVVALIFSTVYQLVTKSHFSTLSLIVAVITTLVIVFVNINPIYMIIFGVVGALIYNKYIKVRLNSFLNDIFD